MAKDMCQHFIDARLIENAADPTSGIFKDRGVYMITAKGLHMYVLGLICFSLAMVRVRRSEDSGRRALEGVGF